MFSTSGEVASLIEFGAWFNLPWFEGELVLLPWSQRGVWSFAIEKPCVVVAPLNLVFAILMAWLEGELCFYLVYL
jgi:hypothetical protein